MSNEIPRRVDMQRMTAAELAILEAVRAVEAAGADVRLTDAVVLLGEARDCVSDYVDGIKVIRRRPDRREWQD
jgi:hypothetical protein